MGVMDGGNDGGQGGGNSGAGTGAGTGADGKSAGSGGGSASWRDSLPEDIRGNAAISQIQDIPSLAKSYIHAQGLVGKKGVMVPGEKSTDEEWQNFFKAAGRPEMDKYDIKAPEGKQLNQEFLSKFKETAHKAGLLPRQLQSLFDWYSGMEEESMKSMSSAEKAAESESIVNLKKEWGDGYDRHLALARMARDELGGPDFAAHLTKLGIHNDVNLVKVLAKVGALMGEDKIKGDPNVGTGQTPQEVSDEIAKMRGDLKGPYFDKTHAAHGAAVRRMEELYKKLTP